MEPDTSQSEGTQLESMQSKGRQAESEIIAAIDFGTSYTGFAYAFRNDIEQIFTGTHGNIFKNDRVPTILRLNPDGAVDSFGDNAESKHVAPSKNRNPNYRLFRRFKMALYSNDDMLKKKDLNVRDIGGENKRAIDVFAIIIKHLKELILKSMKQAKVGVTSGFESKILWMLTIPAIWSDSARQFMREAAMQGGIPEENLRLVLEPEAAALFCKSVRLGVTEIGRVIKLSPGTKYILADLGGGTADICAHEILEDYKVRELYRVQGGPFGGVAVDIEFIHFLIKLFGADTWKSFEKNKIFDYTRIMDDFESTKRSFNYQDSNDLLINVSQSLVEMLRKNTDCTLEERVANTEFSENVEVIGNTLCCSHIIMKQFFKPSTDGIVKTLVEIVLECEKDKINTLLLVGGFANCPYVRDFIKNEMNKRERMSEIDVVLVQEPHLAVLKGAIFMGSEPVNIIERRARYTYGFGVAVPFEEGTHPEFLKFTRDDRVLCNNIFRKVIEKDQILTCNQEFKVSTSTKHLYADSKRSNTYVSLYRTDKYSPKYCLETENCAEVGKIIVEPPVDGWPDAVNLDNILIVGETEFTVKAFDQSSEKEYETRVDFL